MTPIDNIIENGLTREQHGAITRGIKLGRTLQQDHPDISQLWKQGNYYSNLVDMLDIKTSYGVGYNVAITAVHYAIAGHDGSFDLPAYDSLIPEEERKEIEMEHKTEGGRKTYEERKGVHGRTPEQMSIDGRKAGRKTYEEGKGIHGRTLEQMSIDGHKGSRKGIIARGFTPWTNEETEFAYQLSQQPEYQRKTQINNQLIALELNIQYHNCEEVRTKMAINQNLSRYRKSLADKLE